MQRVEAVLERRPEAGLHDDAPARRPLARRHAGGGEPRQRHAARDRHARRARRQRRPGHAGLAVPGGAGLLRRHLHRHACGRGRHRAGDARGRGRAAARTRAACLGMADGDGTPVPAGPREVHLAGPRSPRRAWRPSGCGRWWRTAAAARRSPPGRDRPCRSRCGSTSTPPDGRAVGDLARGAPGRRHLHPRLASPPRGATTRPAPTAAAPLLEPGAERVVIFHLVTEGDASSSSPASRRCGWSRATPSCSRRATPTAWPRSPACRRPRVRGSRPSWRAARASSPTAAAARRRGWCAATSPATTGSRGCCWRACRSWSGSTCAARTPALGWKASVRYALGEVRSPRPGGAGVLAKLAEVLFIEVLRLYMNEQSEGRTGWLAGVRDRIIGAALSAMHQQPGPSLDAGRAGARVGHLALGAGRALPARSSAARRCST